MVSARSVDTSSSNTQPQGHSGETLAASAELPGKRGQAAEGTEQDVVEDTARSHLGPRASMAPHMGPRMPHGLAYLDLRGKSLHARSE
jgi:hypothetical protein